MFQSGKQVYTLPVPTGQLQLLGDFIEAASQQTKVVKPFEINPRGMYRTNEMKLQFSGNRNTNLH